MSANAWVSEVIRTRKEGKGGAGVGTGVQGAVSQCSALFGGRVSFLLLLFCGLK